MNCRLLVSVPLLLASATFGCMDAPKGPSVRSDVEVRLPETPDFESQPAARMYPDGAHSVMALMETADLKVGREVTVRGLVADTVLCALASAQEKPKRAQKGSVEAKAQERREAACHPPSHLYLADDVTDETSRLLVVGWAPNKVRGVRRGQELTFRGTFGRVSPDGVFIRQAGLVTVSP
jgi:hypothetical protein